MPTVKFTTLVKDPERGVRYKRVNPDETKSLDIRKQIEECRKYAEAPGNIKRTAAEQAYIDANPTTAAEVREKNARRAASFADGKGVKLKSRTQFYEQKKAAAADQRKQTIENEIKNKNKNKNKIVRPTRKAKGMTDESRNTRSSVKGGLAPQATVGANDDDIPKTPGVGKNGRPQRNAAQAATAKIKQTTLVGDNGE